MNNLDINNLIGYIPNSLCLLLLLEEIDLSSNYLNVLVISHFYHI